MDKKIPEIRFKGLEGEWKTIPLSDIAIRIAVKNDGAKVTLPLTISAQYGLIAQEDFFNSRIAAKDVSGYYVIHKGEFAYNRSSSDGSPFGAVKRLDNYEDGVLSTLYLVFKLTESKISSDYITVYFDTDSWHQHISGCAAEGARNHGLLNITSEDFFKTPVNLPTTVEEQSKIAKLFTTIDKLIDKLEQKLEKLRNIKQALLNQMFINVNGGGYETPLLRFARYNEPWVMKQLGEYLSVFDEKNQNEQYDKHSIFSVSRKLGIVNQIAYQGKSFAGSSLKNYRVVHADNIVYTKSPLKEQPYGIIKSNVNGNGIVSALYAVYRTGEDVISEFVQTYFESDTRLNNYLRRLVNKGAKNTLLVSDEDALNGIVAFPKRDEQTQITMLFSGLGSVINKQEAKLAKLRNTKQSLLHKMFV